MIVENYSKYKLQEPRFHRVKTNLTSVGPGSSEFFVCEKEENGGKDDDVHGGVSWQIDRPDVNPFTDGDGRTARLLIKFHVKYRCVFEAIMHLIFQNVLNVYFIMSLKNRKSFL